MKRRWIFHSLLATGSLQHSLLTHTMSFIYHEYLSYYAWQAIAAGYLSLSLLFSPSPLLFLSILLRLIDLTSI
ncbi:hypothetical protein BJX65DRAFT_74643 [Aspergillus insuetus]